MKLVVQILVFTWLLSIMKSKHNYEYLNRKRAMKNHFAFISIFYFTKMLLLFETYFCELLEGRSVNEKACVDSLLYNLIYELTTPIYLLILPYLIVSYSMVFIKPLDDPFEGISKLDRLVMVSYFQRSNFKKQNDLPSPILDHKLDLFEEKQERQF